MAAPAWAQERGARRFEHAEGTMGAKYDLLAGAQQGDADRVRRALELGANDDADVNYVFNPQNSPWLDVMVESTTETDVYHWTTTALYIACSNGRHSVVQVLLEAHADIEQRAVVTGSTDTVSCLSIAAEHGHVDCCPEPCWATT